MKRAVIYARFSSDMQREESIDAQVRACKAYITKKGYDLVKIYADEAKSGTNILKRDEYNQMIADAITHEFDVIIFHKIDRNSRNELNYYKFKETLSSLGIEYEYASQNIDASPEGQMMESMLVGLAAYYSRNLSKETKKGLNENAYKGLFNGGTPPLGYDVVDKKYVINEKEAEIVRTIFNLYLEGYGYTRISQKLAAMGAKTKAGRNFSKNSLYDILGNQKYIGIYTFNRVQKRADGKKNTHQKPSEDMITLEGVIPAIIDMETWDNVATLRAKNRANAGHYKSKEQFLLTGKMVCGYCGSAIGSHVINHSNGKTYKYYVCLQKERNPSDKCEMRTIPAEDMDDLIITTITQHVLSKYGIRNCAENMYNYFKSKSDVRTEKLKDLTHQKDKALAKLGNIYNLIELNGPDDFNMERLNATKKEIKSLESDIMAVKATENVKISRLEIEKTLQALLDDFKSSNSDEARKSIVSLFVDKIIVKNDDVTLQLSTDKFSVYLVPRTRNQTNRKFSPYSFEVKASRKG